MVSSEYNLLVDPKIHIEKAKIHIEKELCKKDKSKKENKRKVIG